MIGSRKLWLGLVYIVLGSACVWTAVWRDANAGVIAAIAAAFVSLATGLGVVVWGNVQEHRANGRM